MIASWVGPSPAATSEISETYVPAATNPDAEEQILEDIQLYSRAEFRDCNGNGIRDSIDIAENTADDVNHNGMVDECDPDETFNTYRYSHRDDWKAVSAIRDTSFFWSGHFQKRVVLIRYTVPPSGARVKLSVRNSSGETVTTLVDAKQRSDAYSFTWDRRSRHGVLAPPGTYMIKLKVGKRHYVRRVRWQT